MAAVVVIMFRAHNLPLGSRCNAPSSNRFFLHHSAFIILHGPDSLPTNRCTNYLSVGRPVPTVPSRQTVRSTMAGAALPVRGHWCLDKQTCRGYGRSPQLCHVRSAAGACGRWGSGSSPSRDHHVGTEGLVV